MGNRRIAKKKKMGNCELFFSVQICFCSFSFQRNLGSMLHCISSFNMRKNKAILPQVQYWIYVSRKESKEQGSNSPISYNVAGEYM